MCVPEESQATGHIGQASYPQAGHSNGLQFVHQSRSADRIEIGRIDQSIWQQQKMFDRRIAERQRFDHALGDQNRQSHSAPTGFDFCRATAAVGGILFAAGAGRK